MKNLTQGNPLKVILLFAIPLYIGQLFQLSYGLIDTRIIGSVLGEKSLAAVGTTTSLSDLLVEFLNGIACGFGIIVSTFVGAQDETKMKKAIGGTVTLSIGITLFITAFSLLFLPQILQFLNVSEELKPEAFQYIQIIIAGLIATTLFNVCAAILRAIGDSYTPLLFLVISNVLNIVLDYLMVASLGLGVSGAAIATVIAQIVSAVCCYFYMRKKHPQLRIALSDLKVNKAMCSQLIPSGLSM